MDDERKFNPVTPEAKKDIRPDFLGEKNSDEKSARNSEASSDLKSAENAASEESSMQGKDDGAGSVQKAEENPRKLYSGVGSKLGKKSKFKMLSKLKKFSPVVIIVVLMIGILLLVTVAVPVVIGALKENLLSNLGFKDRVAILEKVAEYKVKELMADGEMPEALAQHFENHGMIVGQVTVAGEFLKTNRYLAELSGTEVAAEGKYYNNSNGELVIKYGDDIITADNFVMAVESSPKLYAAYSDAIDIGTKYYYSDEVNEAYNKMGVSRNPFGGWEATGDAEKDQESFDELLAKSLDVNYNLDTSGEYIRWWCETRNGVEPNQDCSNGTWKKEPVQWNSFSTGSSDERARGLVDNVGGGSRRNNDNDTSPNQNAAQLLNTTRSASEPYIAASAFMTVISGIEQAQIGDNGPINELMNDLTLEKTVVYRDVNTGETKTEKNSIMATTNFAAAASDGGYSKSEANNFSRDNILMAAKGVDNSAVSSVAIKDTVVSTNGEKQSNLGVVMNNANEGDNDGPDEDVLDATVDIVRLSLVEKSSDVFSSVVGGNRIVEGGSFINNKLAQEVLGAMPSDQSTVMAYQKEVNEILARQKAADRATKSPFDISSPNTFMGSLVRSFANMMIKSYGSNGMATLGRISASTKSLLGTSVGKITLGVYADDGSDSFTSLVGDCDTVSVAANVAGDLYCNAHTTNSLDYLNYTQEELKSKINEDDLAKFAVLNMDREATVGVKSAEVCRQIKDSESSWFTKLKEKIVTLIAGARNLRDMCSDIDEDRAIGADFTLSSSNGNFETTKLYSAYVLQDKVMSYLTGEPSEVTALKKKYYEEHPVDNSYEGKLARASGLSVEEVQLALQYEDYLNMLAYYNPLERYAFIDIVESGNEIMQFHKDYEMTTNTYGVLIERTKYFDVRNRVYSV